MKMKKLAVLMLSVIMMLSSLTVTVFAGETFVDHENDAVAGVIANVDELAESVASPDAVVNQAEFADVPVAVDNQTEAIEPRNVGWMALSGSIKGSNVTVIVSNLGFGNVTNLHVTLDVFDTRGGLVGRRSYNPARTGLDAFGVVSDTFVYASVNPLSHANVTLTFTANARTFSISTVLRNGAIA